METKAEYQAGNALVPVEQRQVVFYGDEVVAVRVEGGAIYVPVRPLCDLLGIAWAAQRRRILDDPVLGNEIRGVIIMITPEGRPQQQEMSCLPLKRLSGWLFGINAKRVKEEVRERLIRYQKECYDVLDEAFKEGQLTAESSFAEILEQGDDDAVRAYQIATAVVKLARNQLLMESRFSGRLDEHEERLEQIEALLGDSDRYVTEAQASRISQAVKAVAIALGKQTKRNEFGGVYGELYRKFDITAYRLLPARRFEEAMKFLTDWYGQLTDNNTR